MEKGSGNSLNINCIGVDGKLAISMLHDIDDAGKLVAWCGEVLAAMAKKLSEELVVGDEKFTPGKVLGVLTDIVKVNLPEHQEKITSESERKYVLIVTDPKTFGYPDLEKIALTEDWAKGLIHCDMDGFALSENGNLVLCDECGNMRVCPEGRFIYSVTRRPE